MGKEARQKVLNFLAVLLLVVNLIPTAAVAEVLKEKELILTQFETVKTTDTYTDIDLAFQTNNETNQPFVKTIQLDEGVSVEAVNLQDQSELADLAGIQLEIAAQPLASGLTEAQQLKLKPEDTAKLKPQELKVTVAANTKKTVKLRLQVNTAQFTATTLTTAVDKQTMTTAFENPLASDSSKASTTATSDSESSTIDTATGSTDSERESNTESDETSMTDESNLESTTSQLESETSEASSTSGDSTETASSGTESTTTTTSEAASETSSTNEISTETSAKTKETTNSSNSTKKNALRAAPQTIESLFNQYAPGDSFVKGVTISPDPITDPNNVGMTVDFGAPEVVQQAMRPGDTFTLPVPNGLDINSTAPIELKQGGDVLAIATMDPANNQIVVTLTTNSGSTNPADYTPEDFTPIASGKMDYSVKIDQQVITHPGKSTIVFPTEYNLPPQTIFINPQTTNSVSKAGTFDKQVNPSNITWKVDVNRTLATLENPTLTETFPPTVSFGSVAIYPEELNMDGTVASVGTTPLVEGEDYEVDAAGNVTFNGMIDQAYQVVYQTPINDEDKPDNGGNVVFKNTAHWNGQDASATLTGKYGARLAKVQNGYSSADQTYKWTIQYNRGFKTIDTTNPIVDTFSNNMEIVKGAAGVQLHYMVANANGSYSQGGVVPTDAYTVTVTDGKMAILFNNNVTQNQAIDITYSTKVNPVVDGTNNVTVNNTVSQEGINNPGQPHVTQPVQQTLIKNKPTLDIGKQIATWTVDVNKNKYQLNNATFTDTVTGSEEGYISFPIYLDSNGNTTPTNDLIQIKDDTGYVLKGAYTANGVPMTGFGVPENQADYVMDIDFTASSGIPNQPYKNFTITFINKYQTTSHSFHMTYMTSYNQFSDPKDPNNPKSLAYVNTINMDWTEENGTEHHSTSTNQFTTSTQEANQGIKSGVYNAQTKEITWTVLANYNSAGVPFFSMTDPIIPNTDPEDAVNSQAYVENSLSILRGTINPSGNFQADGTANYGGEQKEKSYITYTEPNENNGETLQIDVGTDGQRIPGWNGDEPPMVYQIQFKTSLKGKVINQNTYSNVATTEVLGEPNTLSASVSVKYGNNLLSKSGSYAPGDGNIHWQLQINQNQSYLIAPVITDLPSTNQMLIE